MLRWAEADQAPFLNARNVGSPFFRVGHPPAWGYTASHLNLVWKYGENGPPGKCGAFSYNRCGAEWHGQQEWQQSFTQGQGSKVRA